ncbi:hypothetical protein NDU88_000478 [Pleurodeles waltl]|uniref:Uncharacterized protein n=1 Tax=Pleurodeles waltl TaxID=8319 RepID=A0AAV7VXH7_PLEWA|nr:hypothetical protein NDU88_000478 [Pleurodeles waltl]
MRKTGGLPPVFRCPNESSMAAQLAAPPWRILTPHTEPGTGWRYGVSWGPWGPLQCPCQWYGHCRGPRKRAPLCISVSALQTLKYATGATAPVAPSHSAGSILSRRPRGKGVLHWAGGRPFGGRPPAQCKTQNTLSGLSTAERYFGGGNSGGRPPPPGRVRITPFMSVPSQMVQ